MSESISLDAPAWQDQRTNGCEQAERIVLTYRGWDAYEKAHGGPSIVDFDLSSIRGSASFTSRRDVLSALSEMYDQLNGSTAEEDFLRARILGSISYLRALMGQQIAFADYLPSTLGVAAVSLPAEELQAARKAVSESLAPFEIVMRADDRKRFERELVIRDPSAIKRGIVGNQDLWLGRLRDLGIPAPKQVPLSVQFTEADAYWNNWISGSAQKGITLRINVHPRKRYDRGRPLALCLHEVCGHAVQMSIWRELITQGKLSQACGLTTVHSPEAFVAEGLGQTVADLLSTNWEFPPEFHLSRNLETYAHMILHNAHMMIYREVPVERILEYACDHLPLSDPETLEAEIRDRGRDPLFRSYQLSYSFGERAIKTLLRGLSIKQKQALFLAMYTKPLTPAQLLQVGERVTADGQ
jgi:hypothetical protein